MILIHLCWVFELRLNTGEIKIMRFLSAGHALKTFEAAARHLSFKQAADELNVSATAVSHQIKSLESQLDCPLFIRKTREVSLTLQGHELFTVLRKSFDDIDDVIRRVKSSRGRDVVTLGLGPIIGTRWLAPRLGDFWQRHPDIDLRLHHTAFPMQHSAGIFDLAIAWGKGQWAGLESRLFINIEMTPVISPDLAMPNFSTDLTQYPLIHERDRQGWMQWFEESGLDDQHAQTGPIIDDANLVLQTALNGQGIVLGILPFISDDLSTGRLRQPFARTIRPANAYYLIHQPDCLQKAPIRVVYEWLVKQISEDPSKNN
jgi:LysR family transcriptional regulator, glycine cleavage system transcriptional activator